MTGGQAWTVFVEDGAAYAGGLADGVAAQARRVAAGEPLDRVELDRMGAEAYRIAMIALLMGTEELGRLALACERAVDRLAAGAPPSPILPPLAAAAAALGAAFRQLARPDASGARAEAEPVDAARAELERALAGLEAPRAEPTIDLSLASAAASAARAAAATAQSAVAAAAAATVGAAVEPHPAGAAGAADALDAAIWVPQVDDDMIDLFFEEAEERLEGLAEKLLALEERPGDGDLVRELFRDLHTVKGSSGMVGLVALNRVAHAAEDLVGQVRDGARRVDRPLVDALLAALDTLRAILGLARRREPIRLELDVLLARLRDPGAAAAEAADAWAAAPAPSPAGATAAAERAAAGWTAGRQTLRVDYDKLDLLMNLVGELVLGKAGLTAGVQALGSLARELQAERRLARRGLGERRVGAPAARDDAPRRTLHALAEELGRAERVFQEVAHDLDAASSRLDHVAAELRDQVMKLRMLPIGGVFRKYGRTVRDLAHALGKQVRLELAGEDTELDKLLVEQLDEPLLHLVRNAVDHGIEPPEARVAAGKPAEGVLRLSAYHRGNQIVIEVRDDGGGIDPARLRRKAREKGLVPEEELAALDDHEVLDLIFRPGFSTAQRVSEVSGRGVGMDVVRTTIVTRLKGTIDVDSAVGRGTTFTLRLPLTLAIIQVLLARAAGEVFAVPLDVITRTLVCRAADVHRALDREVLAVRDRQVPVVRLRHALELEADDHEADELHVILVEVAGQPWGLVVDRLLGKQEIVIKTLGDLLEEVPCAAGATLLGERCALILDVPAVVARAVRLGRAAPAAPGVPGAPAAPVAPGGAAAAAVPGASGAGASGAGAPARPRVLLVEDSDVIREAMRRMLEGAGYAVTEARDGAEGLRLAEAADFELISTDVMMPHLDGYELTRALRATERHRDTPIIMVTSRGEKIDRVRGFDVGVDEYITKPHDRNELLRAVQKHARPRGRGGDA